MSPRRPVRTPGWYRDPDDPTQLRHWGGERWDSQRSLPAWTIGTGEYDLGPPAPTEGPTLEGPVRGLWAIAAAATAGGAGGLRGLRAAGGGRPLQRVGQTWRGMPPPEPHFTSTWSRTRKPFVIVVALVAVVSLAIIGLAVGSASTAPPPQRVVLSHDTSFVRAADSACTASMGAVRIGSQPTISPAGSSPSVKEVTAANQALGALSHRLTELSTGSVRTDIGHWLATWSAYARVRLQLAAQRPGTRSGSVATGLGQAEQRDAGDADSFALTNGLVACTLLEHAPAPTEQIP